MELSNLPQELLIDILLKTKNKKELINICKTNKRIYYLCKTEPVSKHIVEKFIRIKKPQLFYSYSGFLKHYLESVNKYNKEYDEYNYIINNDIKSFYGVFDDIMRQKMKYSDFDKESFENKYGKINVI